jgi:predicted PhzF superfamily epimerase YddE/YHI9
LCYVWAELGPRAVDARLFFSQDTAIVEDPATGSAAANLGGLLAWRGERGRRVTITQGAAVSRPSRLELEVTDTAAVRVGGLVRPIGGGALQL